MSLFICNGILGHWLLFGVATFTCYYIGTAFYNLFFSPLAKYPGPFLAKISALPNFYYATTGKRHIWLWQCHQVYGTTFRYRPNGVMINSPAAYRDIFNSKANVKKTKFYEVWAKDEDSFNSLTVIDKAVHARKRRTLNSVFSEKSLRSSEAFLLKHIDRWHKLTLDGDGKDWGEARNMAVWIECLIFDILGDLCFGKSFDIKEPEDNPLKTIPDSINNYMALFNPIAQSPLLSPFLWVKSRGLQKLLDLITPKDIIGFENFVKSSVAWRKQIEEEQQDFDEKDRRKDMFHYLLQAKDPNTGAPAYTMKELFAEANLLVIAGSDTTVTSMCGVFFYLTRNPRVYTKLVNEIRHTFQSVDEICGGPKLYGCQYLRACIDEAMRLSPTGGTEMPREAGPGGAMVDGEFYPEGTQLGICIWAFFKNEVCFSPDPYAYRPERWIVDEKNGVTQQDVARAQSCFLPFSSGPGSCVGKNLAMLEMLITIARTLYRMDVRALPGNTLGGGRPEWGWGQNNPNMYQLTDAYAAVHRQGPMVQFRKRQD